MFKRNLLFAELPNAIAVSLAAFQLPTLPQPTILTFQPILSIALDEYFYSLIYF
ncbi:MAG: hypothetical protein F6J87_08855 [Spirulina sp. SIO3F2]|nr:hypothetical protein [Spirulina sp. SIO3F2]